jgi:hypothetical protein
MTPPPPAGDGWDEWKVRHCSLLLEPYTSHYAHHRSYSTKGCHYILSVGHLPASWYTACIQANLIVVSVTPLFLVVGIHLYARIPKQLGLIRNCKRRFLILGFLDRSRYFFSKVAPQLYSRGWVHPVPDPVILRKSGSTWIEPGPLDL